MKGPTHVDCGRWGSAPHLLHQPSVEVPRTALGAIVNSALVRTATCQAFDEDALGARLAAVAGRTRAGLGQLSAHELIRPHRDRILIRALFFGPLHDWDNSASAIDDPSDAKVKERDVCQEVVARVRSYVAGVRVQFASRDIQQESCVFVGGIAEVSRRAAVTADLRKSALPARHLLGHHPSTTNRANGATKALLRCSRVRSRGHRYVPSSLQSLLG